MFPTNAPVPALCGDLCRLTPRPLRLAFASALQQGQPTVPSLLSDELATNPFLRPDSPGVRQGVKAPEGAVDWEVFGLVRRAKDTFK